jgi:hypothetical protein
MAKELCGSTSMRTEVYPRCCASPARVAAGWGAGPLGSRTASYLMATGSGRLEADVSASIPSKCLLLTWMSLSEAKITKTMTDRSAPWSA